MSEINTGMKTTRQFIEELTKRMTNLTDEEIKAYQKERDDQRKQAALSSEQWKADLLNQGEGEAKYFDCRICKNKGHVVELNEDGFITYRTCECEKRRECYRAMERSGISPDMLKRYTFANYEDSELWQKDMKATAQKYAQSDLTEWLLFCGQSGTGKTHLCTAVAKYLLGHGHEVKYMLWSDIARKLMALKFKEVEYNDFFLTIANAEVLYIDDLFKTHKDPMLAFEVLNARYLKKLPTIISTESNLDAIHKIDEATASRISEMARNYCYQIKQDPKRNYRYRKRNDD